MYKSAMIHSRRVIPVIIKRRVAELSADNPLLSPADISREIARIHCFLLSDEEVRRILRRRDAFLDAPPGQTIFRLRTAQYPDFERALAAWYRDEMKGGNHIGMDGVIAHAKKIGPDLGVADTFRYSHGWCFKFMARHGFKRGWQEEEEGEEEGATMAGEESPAGSTPVQQAQAESNTNGPNASGVTPMSMQQQLFAPMQIQVPVHYPGEQQMLALPSSGTIMAGNESAGGEHVGSAGGTDGDEQAHKRRKGEGDKSHAEATEGVLAGEGEGDGMHDVHLDLSTGDDERDEEVEGETEGVGGHAGNSESNKDGADVALLTDENGGQALADAGNADGTMTEGATNAAGGAGGGGEDHAVGSGTPGTDAAAATVHLASGGGGTGAAEGAAQPGGSGGGQEGQGDVRSDTPGVGGTAGRGRGLVASLLGKRGRPKGRPRKHWYPGMVYPGMAVGMGAGAGMGGGMGMGIGTELGAVLHSRPPFLGMGIPGLMSAGHPNARLRVRVGMPAMGPAGGRHGGASSQGAVAAGATEGGGGQRSGGLPAGGGPLGFPAPEGDEQGLSPTSLSLTSRLLSVLDEALDLSVSCRSLVGNQGIAAVAVARSEIERAVAAGKSKSKASGKGGSSAGRAGF